MNVCEFGSQVRFAGEPAEYEGMITDWMTHEELVGSFKRMNEPRGHCLHRWSGMRSGGKVWVETCCLCRERVKEWADDGLTKQERPFNWHLR